MRLQKPALSLLASAMFGASGAAWSASVPDSDANLLPEIALNRASAPALLGSSEISGPLELGPLELTMLPRSILALPKSTQHVLVADLEHNRLYLYAHNNGALQLQRAMYLSIGKAGYGKRVEGDNLSPVGVYTITSWISGDELPPLYGVGAWPVDYPNALDQRLGRTGYGIWLHGNPPGNGARRAPRSSEGCITLANADLSSLQPFIELQSTPVVFADAISWQSDEERARGTAQVQEFLEQWVVGWESLDADELAAMYTDDALIGNLSREQLREQKTGVNARKAWIEVELSELAAYVYPGSQGEIVQVEFDQHYRSSNYVSKSRKRQYWKRDSDGQWRIFLEIPDYAPVS